MENKDKLRRQAVEDKNIGETPQVEKKYSRVLIITMLFALFVLSILLILFLTGVLSGGKLDIEGKCEYKGKIYEDGEVFPVGDGCNSCTCNGDSGSVFCTNMPCVRDESEEANKETTMQEDSVELQLPSDIHGAQVHREYTFGDERFLIYQRPNMNIPIIESNDESGVLSAKEGDVEWKNFFKIRELAQSKNNVFFFEYDTDLNKYVTLLVDANGAGSGEGIAKLVSLDKEEASWEVLDCFYYMPEDWTYNGDSGIRDEVEDYTENNPQYIQDMTSSSCSDFEIVL